MVQIDENARDQFVIVVETDHRTTVSMSNEDALELHRLMTEHFGKIEMVARPKEAYHPLSWWLSGKRGK